MPGDTDSYKLRERLSQRGKVIDLQGHQAAEQVLDALLSARDRGPRYETLVVEAVGLGPPLLTALVRRLDSSRPLILARLARILIAYPLRVQVVQALMRASADRRLSDVRRMGAMLVLSQYLDVQPPEDFLSTLRNPTSTAVSALLGILNDCPGQPEMLLGYFGAVAAMPAEILYSILHMLGGVPDKGAVAALRLLALQPDHELMTAAVTALIARSDAEALASLAALESNLPPEAAHIVARHLHKLRLSGNGYDPLLPQTDQCRALLSPIDGRGRRMLWLVVPEAGAGPESVSFLAILLRDSVGILDAIGAPHYDVSNFPVIAPVGTLHIERAPLPGETADASQGSKGALPLEVPFGYGLDILREAAQENWQSGTPLPLEYQLLFDLVWRFDTGHPDDKEYVEHETGSEDGIENEHELLADPIFESWYLESGAVYLAAQELLAQDVGLPVEMTDQSWRALLPMVIKLARSEFDIDVRQYYSRRLKTMSQWLELAGHVEDARFAASAAGTILTAPPEANLFVLTLVQKGLLVALANMLSGEDI